MRPQDRKYKGVTLTEVIMASAILTIAIIPILKGMTFSNIDIQKIEQRTRCALLAQKKLDQIKAQSIYDFDNGGSGWEETDTVMEGSYICRVKEETINSDLTMIKVKVGFDQNGDGSLDGQGDQDRVVLYSQIARRW